MFDPQQTFNMHPIGVIHTPYGEKFAVPRQPRLVESTHCTIELFAPYCDPQACIGLEGFSHIHVLFVFDQIPEDKFRPMIRPPRLGGNQRVGVFASRSPFRPNRIGLSILELEKVEVVKGKSGFASEKPHLKEVVYTPKAQQQLAQGVAQGELDPQALAEILAQDPRPAYKGDADVKDYFAQLMGYKVTFQVHGEQVLVVALQKL